MTSTIDIPFNYTELWSARGALNATLAMLGSRGDEMLKAYERYDDHRRQIIYMVTLALVEKLENYTKMLDDANNSNISSTG